MNDVSHSQLLNMLQAADDKVVEMLSIEQASDEENLENVIAKR